MHFSLVIKHATSQKQLKPAKTIQQPPTTTNNHPQLPKTSQKLDTAIQN